MKLESGGIDWEDIELTNLTTRASRFKGTDSLNPLYLCRQVFSLLLQFYCTSPFHPVAFSILPVLGFFGFFWPWTTSAVFIPLNLLLKKRIEVQFMIAELST